MCTHTHTSITPVQNITTEYLQKIKKPLKNKQAAEYNWKEALENTKLSMHSRKQRASPEIKK